MDHEKTNHMEALRIFSFDSCFFFFSVGTLYFPEKLFGSYDFFIIMNFYVLRNFCTSALRRMSLKRYIAQMLKH